MNKLLFASNNPNKLKEVKDILKDQFELLSLSDIGHFEDLLEVGNTIEENALQKARFIYQKYDINCFSEDTGLEVEILNNEPGVYSARYAGPQKSDNDNIQLLLNKLKNQSNRNARFRTVIVLILNQKEYLFEGTIYGKIALVKKGISGFGYDPIFIPCNYEQSFGELSNEIKNRISHRSNAIKKLIDFLELL